MTFDWVSFGLQLFNVVVLLAILQHFLFKPIAAVMARRQGETDAAWRAAEAAKAKADAAAAQAEAEAAANRAARLDVLQKARGEAESQRDSLITQAHTEAARIVADGKAMRERDDKNAQDKVVERARELASTIARRALQTQPQALKGYVERLTAVLSAMQDTERSSLLRSGGLTLVSAAPLLPEEHQMVLAALEPFGVKPAVITDPALILGLELRSQSGVVRNSLQHDLDRMTEAMRDEH